MTAPAFKFRNADTSRGLISSGEGSAEFYHPLLRSTLLSVGGFLLVLNGWNLNRCLSDITGYDGTASTAVQLLQMRAPREPLAPLVSMAGAGRVFRPGAKWRYRWKDSRTGQTSGLSPVPDTEINMGIETPEQSQTYLGMTAWFYIPTSGCPAAADTIELFANTTQEDEVWYLADAQPIGSSSYVLLTDDNTDDELFTKVAVVTGNPSAIPGGMTWSEGIMWPVAKAWLDPAGRVRYYGLRRFGRSSTFQSTVALTQGGDLCTVSAGGLKQTIEPGRVGQRVRFYTSNTASTAIADPTVYRLVKVETFETFRVWPEFKESGSLAAGATANWYYAFEDDRDARWTWISEPGIPWLIDPLKVLAAGEDYDDGTMAWFSYNNRVFMQTKRHIYEALGSVTDNPATSTLFAPKADEGCCGLFAGCETPFGWVYVHESRGPRIFDGEMCRPLSGNADPFQEFQPATQFANFEPSMMEEVEVTYDGEHRAVLVSYVPIGQSTRKEVLCFSTAERIWRGPYRDRISAVGALRSTASSDVMVTGNDFGSLLIREAQALDVTPTMTSFAGTGTITSVQTNRVFSDSSATNDADADERARGSPIWFSDGTYLYFAWIADVFDTHAFELDGPPVREDGTAATLTVGWTYALGSIRWSVTSAYIDGGGDPVKPVEIYKLDCRHARGTGSETFEVAASSNASGTFQGVRTSSTAAAVVPRDVNGKVHSEMRLKCEGALAELRVRGLARLGHPQITGLVVIGEEREGALPT